MSYKICEVAGCGEDFPASSGNKYCHYHTSLLDRPCAYYYHKDLALPVEWCYKHNKRYDDLPCEFCPDKRDPLQELEWAIKLVKKLENINFNKTVEEKIEEVSKNES